MLTGSIEYRIEDGPVLGLGISITEDELESALDGPVAKIIFDTEETARLTLLIESIPDTNFTSVSIQGVFSSRSIPKNWRVGEALAEVYLVYNHACQFPWPNSRDEKKSGSSLPGADLVGFHKHGSTYRFAFGEVKTSCESRYPPGVMYGRSGFKQQLEDLKGDQTIRDDLVKYLAHRAANSTWLDQFIEAAKRYFSNSGDCQIFGILIRDVPPNGDDLHSRTNRLGLNCANPMSIRLFAFYLPTNRIPTLSENVMRRIQGGNT